jgi:hypothetical protein
MGTNKIDGGDCYIVAGQEALNRSYNDKAFVCHGSVVGQGRILGVKYTHAWIEFNGLVIDKSNGNDVTMTKEIYYKIGNVSDIKRYSFKEARDKMIETGHFGNW